jgi:hypothetical protein
MAALEVLATMKRVIGLFLLPVLLANCASSATVEGGLTAEAYSPPQGSVVLRVEVRGVEFTDLYPGCGDEKDCIPFVFWHKYRARLKEVLSGDWQQTEVEFTHLQHAAYIDKVTQDLYVVLEPASEEMRSKIGVPFVADRLLSSYSQKDRAIIKTLNKGN